MPRITRSVVVNFAVAGPLPPIRTHMTPFTAAVLLDLNPAVPTGATLLLEESGDAITWTTKATYPAGSIGVRELFNMQRWTRFNVSVVGTGTHTYVLEGHA